MPNHAYITTLKCLEVPNHAYIATLKCLEVPNHAYIATSKVFRSPNHAYIATSKVFRGPNHAYIATSKVFRSSIHAYISTSKVFRSSNYAGTLLNANSQESGQISGLELYHQTGANRQPSYNQMTAVPPPIIPLNKGALSSADFFIQNLINNLKHYLIRFYTQRLPIFNYIKKSLCPYYIFKRL